ARSWLLADRRATFLTALDEQSAIHAVLRLVGRSEALGSQPRSGAVRYPFDEPAASNLDLRLQTFTGRESDLLAVRRRLQAGGAGQPAMVALQGMGGVGKSQIALEYAHRFRNAYDVVWSVKADPVTFIDTQLSELGHQLGLPLSETRATVENTRTVLEALSRNPLYRRWLLIFDNAEDPERVLPFMPKGSGHIVVTSRKPAWRVTAGPEAYLEVDVFPRVESIQHLRARAPKVSATEANEVASLVGDLPLAVNAAGAFLSETSYSVERFLDAVRTGGPNALPLPSDESVSEELRERPVQAVWEVSLNELEQRSAAAYRLLQFCSVMDPSVALDLVYSDELNEDLVAIDPKLSESMVRGRLIRELSRLALARTDGQAGARTGGRLTVHRLIQDMVRYRMTDTEREEIRHQVHLALARFRPGGDVDNPQNWPVFRMIWPHLQASGAVGCPDDRVRSLLIDRVRYLWLVGDFRRGLRQAEETERVWRDRLAEIPAESEERHALRRQLLHLQFNKANLIRSVGDFATSRQVDEEVLSDQRELLGEDHPHTLSTAGGLGGDLRGLGLYSAALELDQQTYELWREAFGEGHPRTLTSLGNLATCWRLMGDYKQAQVLDEQVVRGRQEILGDRHPSTLQSMASVGRDLREAGEYQRSVYQLRIVAQALADEFGPESWETLNANVNLAISMRSAGRVEEARRLLDTAYGHMSESFRTAPNTLACRLSRAVTLLGASDEQAHAELRLVREDYRKRLGDEHPHTLVCVNDLAMAALTTGTPEAAEAALELAGDAAGKFAVILGADHPYVLAAETNLAVCLAATGKDTEALAMLRSTVQRALTRLGETHPDTLSCQANIAILAERSGEPRLEHEADPGTIGRRFSDRFGSDHPTVQEIERKRLIRRVIDPIPF
ncbi:MAG TPA: FxSxx-COOH system tetratricopeptide repeat protein, partial [Actinoplanes sp.]|nr:FxSxx-COOH system tetratricopeptide repeat protein [Actinoplanes sp.]